jgi:hypothetical protein
MASVSCKVSDDGVWIEFRSGDGSAVVVTATDLRVPGQPGFEEKIREWAAETMAEDRLRKARAQGPS